MGIKNDFAESSKYYDIILGKEKYEKYAKFVGKILQKNGVKSILELGCGSGLYMIPLKKLGFEIEGLDISKDMLEVAKEQDASLVLYEEDMSKFELEKKYDSILCLNSSLILLPNMEMIEETLRRCKEHLSEKGLLLIDIAVFFFYLTRGIGRMKISADIEILKNLNLVNKKYSTNQSVKKTFYNATRCIPVNWRKY